MVIRICRILVALVAAVTGVVAPATAQEQPGQMQSQEFSREKLQAFVAAFLELDRVRQDFDAKIQAAITPGEQSDLRAEARQEMLTAIESTDGISVEEYEAIASQARQDPILAERIETSITSLKEK
ncbi:DUF4168 domain-containing protein [Roseibium salinum]|uniref:DUF4168 domain-containing protein n=1 Tax=Roseibium salinum TaxID=1604349 RepID=A0ABT3R2F5_9HYPH|nr:DUF4168 domain-containing protein [Roseibium sp. DSM 29163]MCX2723275.1 DUF4168 domain-containing protein [Roseibium sp. DSM 29163]